MNVESITPLLPSISKNIYLLYHMVIERHHYYQISSLYLNGNEISVYGGIN